MCREVNSKKMAEQTLIYIHNNPLQEKWNLANAAENYKYSSALYYEFGHDQNDVLTNYVDYFG